ncbi:Type-1 restriction enzyme EcoKI specificity protein [Phycisphaerae bacterium RAS1]|nr:Type-1 restriction enzyme EcoKI specificity protein [Phycisphaerae bacterium RAS1]
MKPYPDYRDSGVPWLGTIPAHWEVKRIRRLARIGNGSTPSRGRMDFWEHGDIPWLNSSSVHQGRITKAKQFVTTVAFRECHLPMVPAGSVLVAITGQGKTRGTAAVLATDSTINQHMAFITPQKDRLFGEYLHWHLSGAYAELRAISDGAGGTKGALTCQDVKEFPIALPPFDEQRKIASYLDAHGRLVQQFIRNRRRLIGVLNERRQAVIDRLVTRGKDPGAVLRPSGIDWLGEVPAHWDVLKLKRVARIDPSRSESVHLRDSDGPAVFLPMERISTDGQIDASDRRPVSSLWQGFTYFRRNDVILAKITPCFQNGKSACLSQLPTPIGFGTTELIVLRAGSRVVPEFLRRVTCLSAFRRFGVESMTGAAGQQRVSLEFVANFSAPMPPIEEQHELVRAMSAHFANADRAIADAERGIALVREYRTRLIADVVTGKIDVRGLTSPEAVVEAEATAAEIEGTDGELGADVDEAELVEEGADAGD